MNAITQFVIFFTDQKLIKSEFIRLRKQLHAIERICQVNQSLLFPYAIHIVYFQLPGSLSKIIQTLTLFGLSITAYQSYDYKETI